ncbi:PQQ repeat protein [Natrialba magadii ATCC 43099]|uniref:PQQ repeat protein n=1 Tax=Natrialba magadii (strain ATCC 43099 / DSM 3394 / CCM 3739 / CIP 104546 / IAM 13178 / JCM 8861 / NBRC 102185 / NCIMB 2190 / MS3) TaxID=547559 RepID=D3SZ05_NATMM|nr:PQQ-binding-like beta-propeller repeat protein [Natrialba magadii]ADD06197.1 PQQ repeat protein [Natrialba magadii ATCC 43099]ELY30804.1 pyrrolo-quinoline quinone [Natrialba magadii ATCC 43099]
MVSRSRRRLLGAIGTGAALAGGGYWLSRRRGVDCPDQLEPTHEYTQSEFGIWSRPVLDDGTVFVGGGESLIRIGGTRPFRLLALNTRGEPEWVARRDLEGGFGTPCPTADRVFVSTGANRLFAFDRATGHLQWEFDAGNNSTGSMGVITLVHDETVIASVNEPSEDRLEDDRYVVGLSATDGELRWSVAVDGSISNGFTRQGDTVIAVTEDGNALGIDPETGAEQWQTELEGALSWNASPVVFSQTVWVPREDGTVIGFDPETGRIIERLSTGPPAVVDAEKRDGAFGSAVYATDTKLLVGDLGGTVTAYDADQSESWRYEGDARVAALDERDTRIAVVDQRGVYTELDRTTGEQYRSFLLADNRGDDQCGRWPSDERYRGIVTTGRSLFTTGRVVGTNRYRVPVHE